MRLPASLILALALAACDSPHPAQEPVLACHRQILNSALHKVGDIIEVADHRQVLVCMASKGFGFQSTNSECIVSMAQADNPACYTSPK
jgi:hypothetical protein